MDYKTKSALIVGVSGGVDSLALLHHVAVTLGEQMKIHPVYIDHNQRLDTGRDWKCVRNLSRRLRLSPVRLKLRLKPGASEAELRKARYAAFKSQAKKRGAALLTAHHADDQVETYLLKILRGAHPDTIRGIAEKGEIEGLVVFRPFLNRTKEEILDYAKKNKIRWNEDSTNDDLRFARNRVRHELLPLLESIRPRSAEKILRFFSDLEAGRPLPSAKPGSSARLTRGVSAKKLDFIRLRTILRPLLGECDQRTTRAQWESIKRILQNRQATKTGGGPRKLVQFPGGGRLVFEGTLVRWERADK